ncbi:MAG: iron-containing alcohol dehydrogenase [Deltaproteobacteria bacterium]|nr:iron-containing alcohol dehydrogenase [Deltaproteobacteria bacterium]
MKDFSFSGIKPIIFGVGRVDHLADEIAALSNEASEILVISDAGVVKAGIVERIQSILERSGLNVTVFGELTGEPHSETIDAAAAILRRMKQPCVIGLGGGSALDVAKLAATIAEAKEPVESYALCAEPLPGPRLKRIMIPTTAGTGAEMTQTAVFSTCQGRKVWAWGPELVPDLVILDPSLTISIPGTITAITGMDALVHAMEAFTCQQHNPISDALALQAVKLVGQHLIQAIESPSDMDARSGMLIASTIAGSAFAQTGTGGAHSIGHALATLAGIPHGQAVTMGMDVLLDWNTQASPRRHAAVAEALGYKNGENAATAFRTLADKAGIDLSLAGRGVDPEILARVMLSDENMPMTQNNARAIGPEDALVLARRLLAR